MGQTIALHMNFYLYEFPSKRQIWMTDTHAGKHRCATKINTFRLVKRYILHDFSKYIMLF